MKKSNSAKAKQQNTWWTQEKNKQTNKWQGKCINVTSFAFFLLQQRIGGIRTIFSAYIYDKLDETERRINVMIVANSIAFYESLKTSFIWIPHFENIYNVKTIVGSHSEIRGHRHLTQLYAVFEKLFGVCVFNLNHGYSINSVLECREVAPRCLWYRELSTLYGTVV